MDSPGFFDTFNKSRLSNSGLMTMKSFNCKPNKVEKVEVSRANLLSSPFQTYKLVGNPPKRKAHEPKKYVTTIRPLEAIDTIGSKITLKRLTG